MSNAKIRWYSVDSDMVLEEQGSIGIDEALKIVDRYFARGGEKFASAEDAIAATMFGFSRSETEFIEICIHGPGQITYKFEMSDPDASWFRKLFGGVFQHEEQLRSREALVHKVKEFFTTPVQEVKQRLQNR